MELPHLAVIYNIFRVMAASEAQCERYFSSEAILHTQLRNRLDPNLVAQILWIRFNQSIILQKPNEENEELEEVEYED
jgi:hypothetical protein